ncbi:MAG: hypothetical protein C0607_18355 [Azoarcus sp.]|nr:MAG: hypothetical protein C0607_18355 [Azoarcus sp.]
MDNLDIDVLERAHSWLGRSHRVTLVTVVRTWGSSPRPPGSLLALRDDGHVTGSVSGGCIEDDLIDRMRREGPLGKPQMVRYGVGAEEARRFGLPCGGTMELVLEPLATPDALTDLLDALRSSRLVARRLDLASGLTSLGLAAAQDGVTFDGQTLTTVFGPRYRVLLIGAGALSACLANIALALDFTVTVCDPREAWYAEWSVQHASLVRDMPDDVVTAMRPDARTAIVALTHDPKLDDLALMEALRSPAFYVGAIGSRRNNEARRQRLRLFDLDAKQVARLRGPVGLYIGSRTPAEIAVSIAAEIVAVRNGAEHLATGTVRAGKEGLASASKTGAATWTAAETALMAGADTGDL